MTTRARAPLLLHPPETETHENSPIAPQSIGEGGHIPISRIFRSVKRSLLQIGHLLYLFRSKRYVPKAIICCVRRSQIRRFLSGRTQKQAQEESYKNVATTDNPITSQKL